MNILHVTPYYAPAYAFGGVTRAVEGMARALVRHGHTVTVLTTDALTPTERCTDPADEMRDGVRVLRARNLFKRGTLNLSTPIGLRGLLRDLTPDVIHCHEFRTVENLLLPANCADGAVAARHADLRNGAQYGQSIVGSFIQPPVSAAFQYGDWVNRAGSRRFASALG